MEKMINGSKLQLALADYLATNAYINDTAQDVLIMVAKWIDEAPAVNAWIPVTERLPERGAEVIVCSHRTILPVVFTTNFWDAEHDNWIGITYWMPLPEPPKEVE